MERKVLAFRPTWSGEIEGWATKFVMKNAWRLAPGHDQDDCFAEARYIFAKVRDRYPRVVDAAHFMSLFKRSLTNHFHDIARKASVVRDAEVLETNLLGEEVTFAKILESGEDRTSMVDADFRLLLEDAPAPVRKVLDQILSEQPPRYQRRNGVRETTEAYLQRIAGVGDNIDVAGMIKRLLHVPVLSH